MFKIAIVGRPNVGKSTLFNRLTGRKFAIVDDIPGVTRDRREATGNIGPMHFLLVDTAGLEDKGEGSLANRMTSQSLIGVEESDVSLFVIDGKVGITKEDLIFSNILRKTGKKIITIVNKCDGGKVGFSSAEAYRFGFGEPVCISAEHGDGLVDLYDALSEDYEKYNHLNSPEDKDQENKKMQIAIIGRPNAGKSTLINKLIGEDRLLTGPEAGITRDAISIDFEFQGKSLKLIDTAGIRKKSQVHNKLEKLSLEDSFRSVRFAHVVVLLIDATCPLESQDISLANIVVDEGRALIVAINKWDLIENKSEASSEIKYKVESTLSVVKGVPIIYLSAKNGDNIYKVMQACFDIYEVWNHKISTHKLNEWLKNALEKHPLPLSSSGRRIRVKYITQTKIRPPTFVLFASYPDQIPDTYIRYLINSLRDTFNLGGIPIRFYLRKSDNPYAKK